MTVLDSSAVLALLLAEAGADKVAARLAGAVMSSVNLAEVVGVYARRGAKAEDIRRLITDLGLVIHAHDAELALATGLLAQASRPFGLSLGDRACLALAQQRSATLLTADERMQQFGRTIGIDVQLIR